MTNEYSFISKACYVKSYYPNNLGVRPYMIKLFVHPIPIKKKLLHIKLTARMVKASISGISDLS